MTVSHVSIPEDVRQKNGIFGRLLRLSVGCEDGEDLIEDLNQALSIVKAETVSLDAVEYGSLNDKEGLRLAF